MLCVAVDTNVSGRDRCGEIVREPADDSGPRRSGGAGGRHVVVHGKGDGEP